MDDSTRCQQQMTVLYVNNRWQYYMSTMDDSTKCQQHMTVLDVNIGWQ